MKRKTGEYCIILGQTKETVLLSTLLWLMSPSCGAIDKCLLNGSVTYTDQPCPKEAIVKPFIAQVSPPTDADANAARQRYHADLQQLQQIEKHKLTEQKQRESASKAAARYDKAQAAKASQCHRLETRKQTLLQQLSALKKMARKKQSDHARRQLHQAEQAYRLQCQTDG